MKNYLFLIVFCLGAALAQAQQRPAVALKQDTADPTQLQGPPFDIKPPTVVCLNGFHVDLLNGGFLSMWASDFLQYVEDNVTPAADIKIGIRKAGTGTGFPVDNNGNPIVQLNFDCLDLGNQMLELWAIDAAGNAAYCETGILISDIHGYCNPLNQDTIKVCINWGCDDSPMPGIVLNIDGNPGVPSPVFIDSITGADGCIRFQASLPLPYLLTPEKDDDPLNGVNTLDLLLISEHVLGLQPLDNPYKLIAADANKSGSITTFDVVELKKLIEGIYTQLPNNTSWRFIDADFMFVNPNNPFQTAFPESIYMGQGPYDSTFAFKGIKVGDVDCSAQLQLQDYPDALLSFPDTMLTAGQTYSFPLYMSPNETWTGYQFALSYLQDKLKFIQVIPGQWGVSSDWGILTPGILTTTWLSPANPVYFAPGQPIAFLRFQALTDVNFSDAIAIDPQVIRPLGYAGFANETRDLLLQFVPQLTGNIPADRTVTTENLLVSAPYPNPGTGKLYLPLSLKESETLHLRILDATGAVLLDRTEHFSEGSHLWEVSEEVFLHGGVYGWQVLAGDRVFGGEFLRGF